MMEFSLSTLFEGISIDLVNPIIITPPDFKFDAGKFLLIQSNFYI